MGPHPSCTNGARRDPLTPHASTRAHPGEPLLITHRRVLPPTRAHPSPGESKGRGRGPGDQPSFPGPPPPPVSSSRRGCRHGNARSLGPARQAPSRCRPRRLPRPQQPLRAICGSGGGPRQLWRRPDRGRASSARSPPPDPGRLKSSSQHHESTTHRLTSAHSDPGRRGGRTGAVANR